MNGTVPLEFVVPQGWVQVPAAEVNAPEGSLVLLDEATRGPAFTSNITVGGEAEPAGRRLVDVAEDVLGDLRAGMPEVAPIGREVFETGVVQQVRMAADLAGVRYRLVQAQVYLPLPGAVLRLTLTATEDRFPLLVEDFEAFVSTVQERG
ncbi:hypothetical protein GCM10022222_80170 [Amycolatopsis ultiminotia]|uniref:DUF1795 domain-containing protein n=1 Tax=Amycolatopsis ultiminotia TaxID=543629 RepID=A0ABP6YLZ5_9PSEU